MTLGYVVMCSGRVMQLERDRGTDGWPMVFWFGNAGTLFTDRRVAERAIRRTLKNRPDFNEKFGEMKITRLEPEPEGISMRMTIDREQNVIFKQPLRPRVS